MAKKDKKDKVANVIPEGMKCFQKVGGGSFRTKNRIIKPGQKFWYNPDAIPSSMKDAFKEVPADNNAVIVITSENPVTSNKTVVDNVPEKFQLVKATDEKGEVVKKGNSPLWNVIGEDGVPLNEKPLRKGKAEELLETLS